MLDLSIIIVNYNGKDFLKSCLESIVKHCQTIDYEIILVDNHSSDSSLEDVEGICSNLKIIKNKSNLGFAKANNIGVTQSNGEYILLLNNDTLLVDDLKPAIDLLKTDQTIGTIGIKMLDKNKLYRQSAGYFPTPLRLLKLKSMLIHSNGFNDGTFDESIAFFSVEWIEASFLLTRRKLWEELKGMDETFFMYAEDIDYCKRLSALKKKTVYLPTLSYIHFGGFNVKRNKLLKKGLIHYVNNHFSGMGKWISRLNIELNFFVKEYVKKLI